MLAKAGESDRAIRVKMVGPPSLCLMLYYSISSPAQASVCGEAGNGEDNAPMRRWGVRGVRILRVFLAFTCANVRF